MSEGDLDPEHRLHESRLPQGDAGRDRTRERQEEALKHPSSGRLGRRGELVALLLLLAKGYRLRHRNWTCALGEVDLVVERGGEVVFVEVKTRSDADFGGAAARVDAAKTRRLVRLAAAYLSDFDLWERPTRFDVVTVERRRWWWSIHHIRDAFRADLGRMV